jgi:tetratricopeptide (TPR) repeat protein
VTPGPPPHLAGALRAAAAARAQAERIRSRDLSPEPLREQPPPEKLQTAPSEPQPVQPGGGRSPRFAKTIEAAKLACPSMAQNRELVPWHLSLRQEIDGVSWPRRWMARVFRRRAGVRESEVASQHSPGALSGVATSFTQAAECSATVAAVEPPPRGTASTESPTGLERTSARDRGASVHHPSPEPSALGAKQRPEADGVARLPNSRARGFRWDELSRELPSRTEHEARKWRNASASAMTWRWRWAGAGATSLDGMIATSAARSLVPVAAARAVLAPPSVVVGIAALEGQARLPMVASSRSVIQWSGGRFARAEDELRLSASNRSAAPARRVATGRTRAARRLLLISCGIVGGFAFGIVASGTALITGFNLGQIVFQLDELLFPRSVSAPAAGDASDDTQTTERAVNLDAGVSPSSSGEVQATGGLATTTPGRTDTAAMAGGSKDGSLARLATAGSTASADREPNEPSWAALYARGHLAQSEGDLVAATHWYREAARLNPRHPAILYDLGYMLQIQGNIDDAIDKYRKVLELNPNHAYAQYDLGFLLQKKGDKEGALIQYKKAAELNPENPYIYFDWARILESKDDLAGARALYEKAAELAPQQRPGTDARRRLAALDAR